jgi:hypothetical protein
MLDRQKRMLEAYDYSRAKLGIHTKNDFALALKSSRSVISSALNGNPDYLTDRLCQKVCVAFPGVFNLEYLLSGNGTLLLDKPNENVTESKPSPEPTDKNNAVCSAVLAAKEETIASLRREIEAKDQLINLLKEENERFKFERRYYDSIQDLPNIASEEPLPYRK